MVQFDSIVKKNSKMLICVLKAQVNKSNIEIVFNKLNAQNFKA